MWRIGKFVLGKKDVLPKHSLCNIKCQKMTFTSGRVALCKLKTIKDIRKELERNLQSDASYTSTPLSKKHLNLMAKSQAELLVRRMKDSFDSAIIPLSTDIQLREKYVTFLGQVRIGRLMEDVDLFAAWCCTKHLTNPTEAESQPLPCSIVTVRVDHIELMNRVLQPTSDIRISGHVCWVGRSSLEVIVWLEEEINGKWKKVIRALLLMAARNAANTGPVIVNKVIAETPEEEELLKGGESNSSFERKLERLEMTKESVLKKVPSEEELHVIHNLFMNTMDSKEIFLDKRLLPPKSKWMQDATLNNLVFCHPEFRNLHNKIFGGFLIRQALELSWSVAYLYGSLSFLAMRVPNLTHISDIGFFTPVDVGSLLKFFSSITYAEGNFVQVFVYGEAFTRETGEAGKSTTSFYFTYDLGKPCDSLYPLTYLEAMKYIDGRRHFNSFKKYHEERKRSKNFNL